MNDVADPYREKEGSPAAPIEELERFEWQPRVAKGAGWAQLLLLGEMVPLVVTALPRLAIPGAVAWFVLGAGAVVATWMHTADSAFGVDERGWGLRGSVLLYLGVTGLVQLGRHLEITSCVSGVLLAVAAYVYARQFTRSSGRRRRRRSRRDWTLLLGTLAWLLASGYLLLGVVLLPQPYPWWRFIGLYVLLFAAAAPQGVREAMLVDDIQWWFDNEAESPGAWISLLVRGDGHAKMLRPGGDPRSFGSEDEATAWLAENGYLPAERALAEHLVDDAPPDVLPVTPRRR